MKKKCPECSVLYPLKSLKHHIKTMHSTEIFKCEKCDYTTSEKGEIYLNLTLLGLVQSKCLVRNINLRLPLLNDIPT